MRTNGNDMTPVWAGFGCPMANGCDNVSPGGRNLHNPMQAQRSLGVEDNHHPIEAQCAFNAKSKPSPRLENKTNICNVKQQINN